jgi:hypothetical protein
MDKLNVYQRLNKVMQAVEYVQKDKAVSGGGVNYKAVTHDQVISVCRSELVKNGVMIVPNQVRGEFLQMRDLNATPAPVKMGLYAGTYEINFINIDDGNDRVTVQIQAHANDNGDKAPGKCLTYATKAAILKVLCLETGEDDESRADQRDIDTINEEQQAELFNLIVDPETNNLTQNGQKLATAFKFNYIHEIKSKKFKEIMRTASQWK